jgi:hypothetical protein
MPGVLFREKLIRTIITISIEGIRRIKRELALDIWVVVNGHYPCNLERSKIICNEGINLLP